MRRLKIEGWEFDVSSEEMVFEERHQRMALDFLDQWHKVYPVENTWVSRELGIPSLFVRFDCVPNDGLDIFEVEERPNGIGLSSEINEKMKRRFQELRGVWPHFRAVVSSNRRGSDDHMWLEKLELENALKSDDLLLVRCEPYESDFHDLAHRSVSTVITEGHKEYGSVLGLWQPVTAHDFPDLPWDTGFVLKPLQGSKCKNIEIWHPEKNQYIKQKVGGVSTKTRILKTLEANGKMYCQRLIQPLECQVSQRKFYKIYRVFFMYDPTRKEFVYIGGVWCARPNLLIHGASDSIFGPIF